MGKIGIKVAGITVLFLQTTLLAQCGSTSMAERFNNMAAAEDSQARRVIDALELKAGMTVADLGAGGGFFSYLIAERVGPEGQVLAVDINQEYLDFIEKEATRRKLNQIAVVKARNDGFDAAQASLDMIFTRNVYHHLENRVEYFRTVASLLKPGGRIAILDYRNDGNFADLIGHSTDERIIADDMQMAGLERVQNLEFLEKQSFQIFRRSN